VTTESYEPLPTWGAPKAFRLGVTSYVYPADLLTNVRRLAGHVDDIELVLFESSDVSNLPTAEDIAELAALARSHGLTYTVHFPIDRKLGSADPAERQAMVGQVHRIIELTQPLAPFAYVLHIEGLDGHETPVRVAQWRRDVHALLPGIVAAVDRPDRLVVESLKYPFAWCDEFFEQQGLGVCLDVGHIWLNGRDVASHWRTYGARCRVIHLHGVRDGKDHLALDVLPADVLADFLALIRDFRGVLTLEVFEYAATCTSIQTLAGRLQG
jgi:sugar phosphate isomerase/epimerase